MNRHHIVLDLDGTLFDTASDVVYENAESLRRACKPHAAACALARRVAELGHRVTYLTGRGEGVRIMTGTQLRDANLPPGQLIMQPCWDGFETMRQYKARELRARGATLYIGDHQADADAAALAGVPFLHADRFRAGHLPTGILTPAYTEPAEVARVG